VKAGDAAVDARIFPKEAVAALFKKIGEQMIDVVHDAGTPGVTREENPIGGIGMGAEVEKLGAIPFKLPALDDLSRRDGVADVGEALIEVIDAAFQLPQADFGFIRAC
jgi:hypothetical protein